MKRGKASGEIKIDKTRSLNVNVTLYNFHEDGSEIIYCPALDLYGYGKDLEEAQRMFTYTLNSFFKYTTNKGTLHKLLTQLGWKQDKKSKKSLIPPNIEELLVDREGFKDLVESGRAKVIENSPIGIPEFS